MFAACLISTFLLLRSAGGAVNPELFRENLVSRAPEWVTIEVVAVEQRKLSGGIIQVAASVVVRDVERTATTLEPGAIILVVYALDVAAEKRKSDEINESAEEGGVGMQSEGLPMIVEAGKTYHAHLRAHSGDGADGPVYLPAAAFYSFELPDAVP
jgi:hypothetical protein